MADAKRMLTVASRYAAVLLAADLILGALLSLVFAGGFDWGQFLGYFGDLTLVESVGFFLVGGSTGLYDVASSRPEENEGVMVSRVPGGRGNWFIAIISRKRVGAEDEDDTRIVRAFIYLLSGAMLFAVTVALTKVTGF